MRPADLPRFAIYLAPPADDPLRDVAARWLGYDVESGRLHAAEAAAGRNATRIEALTAKPRAYGFHATIKAPFRLAEGSDEVALITALETFAASRRPIRLGALKVAALGQFLALVPSSSSPELVSLAADCVRDFDHFRAPLTEADLARRHAVPLSERQEQLLATWGYPYVLDEFRPHFTLTGAIEDEAERASVAAHLARLMERFTRVDYLVEDLCLFIQPAADRPFRIAGRYRLGG